MSLETDGCLSHKTAVAMGALTQYLRFLLLADVTAGIDSARHLSDVNLLLNPSLVHRHFVTTASPAVVKSTERNENSYDSIKRNDEEAENQRQQVDNDDNLEIDIQEEIRDGRASVNQRKSIESLGYQSESRLVPSLRYQAENGAALVMKEREIEVGVRVRYKNDESVGSVASSLWYLFFAVLLTGLCAISILCRILRCRSWLRSWLV